MNISGLLHVTRVFCINTLLLNASNTAKVKVYTEGHLTTGNRQTGRWRWVCLTHVD